MGLFGRTKSETFLGVDIGASGIKLVELANKKGRAQLMTYGYAEFPPDEGGESLFEQPKQAGLLLADLVKRSGVKATQAMTSLPSSRVFTTIISVPFHKDQKKLKPLIDAEVGKVAPLPLSELITYSTFLDEDQKRIQGAKTDKSESEKPTGAVDLKRVRVLVTGASKTFVQKYIEIFKTAKIDLRAIDTESFAFIRSLIGKDRSSVLVIDIGSHRTNIIVVEKGVPFVTRSINIGGAGVTDRLKEQMKISDEDAERMKRDMTHMTVGDSGLPGGLPKLLEPLLQPLVNEIQYTLKLFAEMELSEGKDVEKIILTGGSSSLPRVAPYLSAVLNKNVYVGDPWARVVYPKDVSTVLEEIGPRMSVAVGLAMREIE
jgi:type IV pilus assembly protein PilM